MSVEETNYVLKIYYVLILLFTLFKDGLGVQEGCVSTIKALSPLKWIPQSQLVTRQLARIAGTEPYLSTLSSITNCVLRLKQGPILLSTLLEEILGYTNDVSELWEQYHPCKSCRKDNKSPDDWLELQA